MSDGFEKNTLNWFEKFIIERALAKLVIQGPFHQYRITEFYRMVTRAARKQFNEDNKPTLDNFLAECHTDSLDETRGCYND